MVKRLKVVRQGLKERLDELGTPGNWNHITTQTGMFSFTGLTSKYPWNSCKVNSCVRVTMKLSDSSFLVVLRRFGNGVPVCIPVDSLELFRSL
jgi:hypothetical protein